MGANAMNFGTIAGSEVLRDLVSMDSLTLGYNVRGFPLFYL